VISARAGDGFELRARFFGATQALLQHARAAQANAPHLVRVGRQRSAAPQQLHERVVIQRALGLALQRGNRQAVFRLEIEHFAPDAGGLREVAAALVGFG
jgi:hypothetical protein